MQNFRKRVLRFFVVFISITGLIFLLVSLINYCNKNISKEQDIQERIEELYNNKGSYNEQKLILQNTSPSVAKSLAQRLNASLRLSSNGLFATLTLPDGLTVRDVYEDKDNRDIVNRLSIDYYAKITDIEEDVRVTKPSSYVPDDEYYNFQTYLDYLNLGNVWNNYKGQNSVVAIIDTGIDTTHPEFMGRISPYSYNASEDKIVKDYLTIDDEYDWSLIEDNQGHGTAVAGVIGASMNNDGITGIAPAVELLVIKCDVTNDGLFLNGSDLVFGLYYAIEKNADVVNMSFSVYGYNPFSEATRLAVDNDIICVAAAGNDSSMQLSYPAADPNVIGVGALAQNSWELADYSNYGENVDIVAPGTTFTTKKEGAYALSNGTSMAAPIVSAAIALYKNRYYKLEFSALSEVLYASTRDLGVLGKDLYFGYGALDISALMLEERGKVKFNYLTDEISETKQIFIRNHTLQNLPEPDRLYSVFDGWYYDIDCTEELNYYEDIFTSDLTLYAKWVNEDDGIPYTYRVLDDDTIEIISYIGKRKYITIPDYIDEKLVTSIARSAFEDNTNLREVNLPSGLVSIGPRAFYNCLNLHSMYIPKAVKTIGEEAFYNNIRLSYLEFALDSDLTIVEDFAFAYSGISSINLPEQLKDINGSAFLGTMNLETIKVSKLNSRYVSLSGVLYNLAISEVIAYPVNYKYIYDLPETVTTLGNYAFSYSKLSNINLKNVNTIKKGTFSYSNLIEIDLENVSNIGIYSFSNTTSLAEVNIGPKLLTIPLASFYNSGLVEIMIPSNIISIGEDAFKLNLLLEKVDFENNSNCIIIASNAFAYNVSLIEINLPDSLLSIGSFTFYQNYSLAEVNFNNSKLQYIGSYAFGNTYSLKKVNLPSSLLDIDSYAFFSSGLVEIFIPNLVSHIGEGAFSSNYSLENIYVNENNNDFSSVDGVLYNYDKTIIISYPTGNARLIYMIAETVNEIYNSSFRGAVNLEEVILPEGLETIGEYAFYGCVSITNYDLPESLIYIQEYAFSNNINLGTSLYIPKNVYQIGKYAFFDTMNLYYINFSPQSKLPRISYGTFAYSGLRSITIPASVSTIAQEAFTGSKYLHTITFASGSNLESISSYMFNGCDDLRYINFEEGSQLSHISAHGFEGLNKLTEINFQNTLLTTIGNFAFRYCESLTQVLLPNTVTEIGRFSFDGCNSLSSIIIPSSVEFIGRYAFHSSSNLNVYFESETLPLDLQENWDSGIKGYYIGVVDVIETEDYRYAVLKSGDIAILEYLGSEEIIDLNLLNLGGDITQIGGYAFSRSEVSEVLLPETLAIIAQYAFESSKLQNIIIPSTVEFIGRYAFYNTLLQTLEFEDNSSLEKIEQYAFAETKNLKALKLPSSINKLGKAVFMNSSINSLDLSEVTFNEIPQMAFYGTKLAEVIIPNSINLIDHNAFRGSINLEYVYFGNASNLQVMSNAFYNTSLKELVIPENLTYIGEYAFVGLMNLEDFVVSPNNSKYKAIDGVLYNKDGSKLIAMPAKRAGSFTVPKEVETIGFGAFENSKLSSVYFEDGINLLTIGYRAFYNSNLETITIPKTVISIDYYALAMNSKLREVYFEDGSKLTGIYEGTFYGCYSLEEINLPKTIREISDFAFYGTQSLKSLPIDEDSNILGIYDYAFAYSGLDELYLPKTLIDIGSYAFRGLKITELTIPEDNKYNLIIGLGAFADCEELVEITIPFIGSYFEDDNITWFGYIFGAGSYQANNIYTPSSLKKIIINDGLTAIKTGAFYGLQNIKEIDVPHSVTDIYIYAFYKSNGFYELTNFITTYDFSNYGNLTMSRNVDNSFFGEQITNKLYLSDQFTVDVIIQFNYTLLEEVIIPNSVKEIQSIRFFGWPNERIYDLPYSRLYIPNSVESINSIEFIYCGNLTELYIPSTVKNLTSLYLDGCKKIKNFSFPNEVLMTEIREQTFNSCNSLEKIIIPNGIKNIGRVAFSFCKSLKEVVLPDSIEYIGYGAFIGCESLKKIEIPNSVTIIEDGSFYDCKLISEIIIPEGVTNIGSHAFMGCFNLSKITIPSTLTNISSTAFEFCPNLEVIYNNSNLNLFFDSDDYGQIAKNAKTIVLADGTILLKEGLIEKEYLYENDFVFEEIYDEYFLVGYKGEDTEITLPLTYNNKTYKIKHFTSKNVSKIIVPEGFIEIHEEAFYQNYYLEEIILPNTLLYIRNNAFGLNYFLEKIILPDGLLEIGYNAFSNCKNIKSILIPDSVTSVGEYAFSYCTKLNEVKLSKSLTHLLNGIFLSCDNLETITIPEGIIEIGNSCLNSCTQLAEVKLPNSLINIKNWAFLNCDKLSNLYLPENLELFGAQSFSGVKSLLLDKNNTNFIFEEGILYNDSKSEILFINDEVKNIIIPNTIINIDYIFYNKNAIESIVFEEGSSIIEIPNLAFEGCASLKKIVLPNEIETIGENAFKDCKNLVDINFPAQLKYIKPYAFFSCEKLEELIMPTNLIEIGNGAFINCLNLKKVILNEGIRVLGQKAFYSWVIEYINLPNSLEQIGRLFVQSSTMSKLVIDYDLNVEHFTIIDDIIYNKELTELIYVLPTVKGEIIIPEGIKVIPDSAFYGMTKITSIYLPDSVEVIEPFAFYRCSCKTLRLSSNIKVLDASASSLTNLIIPEGVKSIERWSFTGSSNLLSVTLPSTLEEISSSAFEDCPNLYYIENNSNLELSFGSNAYGKIAKNASIIKNKDGSISYKDNGLIYIKTDDEFLFKFDATDNSYHLLAYLGTNDTITLPLTINSHNYKVSSFNYGKHIVIPEGFENDLTNAFYFHYTLESVVLPKSLEIISQNMFAYCISLNDVIIPQGIKKIEHGAFYYCTSLEEIVIPEGVTKIDSNGFANCANLNSIKLPKSLVYIGYKVFDSTAYFEEQTNWVEGALYIDDYLVAVEEGLEQIIIRENAKLPTVGLFDNSLNLKYISLPITNDYFNISSISNLETLVIQRIDNTFLRLRDYFNYGNNIPITLKEVIFENEVDIQRSDFLEYFNNIKIFVEKDKNDVMWDSDYPGWNNNNLVYYDGEWIEVKFYINDYLLDQSYRSIFQIIHQPYVADYIEDGITYKFIGWDLDGDGMVDFVPATSIVNINAHAIFEAHRISDWIIIKEATCTEDGLKQKVCLDCGEIFEEKIITKTGHEEGEYITTIEPTHSEDGYDIYLCPKCGEEFYKNFTSKIPHNFSDWIIINEASCTIDGNKYRYCLECGETEEVAIERLGHNYISTITKEATCQFEGQIEYTCSVCGHKIIDVINKVEHNYVKKYVSLEAFDLLKIYSPNILYVYEGEEVYYYECSMCHHVLTNDEQLMRSLSIQETPCIHNLGEWEMVKHLTEMQEAIFIRKCLICGDIIETKMDEPKEHDHIWDFGIITKEVTCTETGEMTYTCNICGAIKTQEIPALGHNYNDTVFSWDGFEAIAKVICANDAIHVIDLTVEITIEVTKEATCTETGLRVYTASTTYNNETFISTKEEILPSLGHDYNEPVFSWSGFDATAKVVCANDATHVMDLSVEVTSVVTKEATCLETGVRVYTASATFNNETFTSTKEEILPSIGHAYNEPVFSWSNYDASAKVVCANDVTHIINLSVEVVSEVTKEATCLETGVRVYTASATYNNETFTSTKEEILPSIGHDYNEPVFSWDGFDPTSKVVCANDATHVIYLTVNVTSVVTKEATCNEAGLRIYTATAVYNSKTFTSTKEEIIPSLGHAYNDPVFIWSNYEASAKVVCANDATHIINLTVEVTSKVSKEATVDEEGIITYTASATYNNKVYTDTLTKPIPKKHKVTFIDYNNEVIDEIIIEQNSLVKAPSLNLEEGIEFNGWYLDQGYINKWDESIPINKSQEIYLKVNYIKKLELILNPGLDTVYIGTEWIDAGIRILNNDELEYSQNITEINTIEEGRYIIVYSVNDSHGINTSIKRIVNVVKKVKDIEMNLGEAIDTVVLGKEWIDGGCEYIVNNKTNKCNDIHHEVNINKVGTYKVIYKVEIEGVEYIKYRYVYVIDDKVNLSNIPYYKKEEDYII